MVLMFLRFLTNDERMPRLFIALILVGGACALQLHTTRFRPLLTSFTRASRSLQMSTKEVPTILKCDGLSKSWVGTPQFEDVNLVLGKGQKVSIVGPNGTGKSTLLKCLCGLETVDSGSVEKATNAHVVYVDQEPSWHADSPVYSALFQSNDALLKYYAALDEGEGREVDTELLSKATDLVESTGSWDYQSRALSIAESLGILNDMLYRKVGTLSGGEKKRLGIAGALAEQPDVLLMDEPTNHLDVDALDFLANFLKTGPSTAENKDLAVLLVSHDRHFLDQVSDDIIELDRGGLHRYGTGNYETYLKLQQERLRAEDAEIVRAKTLLRREVEWMAKQPKARQAKSKYRQQQFYELVDKASTKQKGTVNAGATRVELMTDEEASKQKRLGGVVVEFKNASYSLPAFSGTRSRSLLSQFTYSFRQNERVAIVGGNGVGKSTFLQLLQGRLLLDSGAVTVGDTVRLGYYDQSGLDLDEQDLAMPVLKFVQTAVEKFSADGIVGSSSSSSGGGIGGMTASTTAPKGRRNVLAGKPAKVTINIDASLTGQDGSGTSGTVGSEREAMRLLQRFMFPSKRWYDRVSKLSGGEKRRLQLLQVLARRPNVLLMDEPSNDLDLPTVQALEDYLIDDFKGCLIFVSHDNFLCNRVAKHLFVFEGGGVISDFLGSYDDYLAIRKERALQKKNSSSSSSGKNSGEGSMTATRSAPPARKMDFDQRKEFKKLEPLMVKLAGRIAELQAKCDDPANANLGYSVLADWATEIQALQSELEETELRWLELAELEQ